MTGRAGPAASAYRGTSTDREARGTLIAALWMVGAIASFATMAVAGRELSTELDTFEIMAYRSALGFPVIVALMAVGEGLGRARTRLWREHGLRNVIHFSAQNAWFYGIAMIPLAQLVALEFTNPIWVVLLAPLLLAERLTRSAVLAALIGFVGILIVARPGLEPLGLGHAAGLFAAIGFAFTNIFTKRLSREDSALCVLFWMTLSQAVMGVLCALPGGMTWPSDALIPWVLLVGLCGLTAHFSLTRALFAAPASVVAPMEFMRLPVIAAAGAVLYGEQLEIAVFVGAGIILAGNIIGIRARQKAAKEGA
ncbi:MAG: DMT family transporter [Pseudomonadota bacterium]